MELTPEDVLVAASDPESPLHPLIEWDDSAASDNYKEAQDG